MTTVLGIGLIIGHSAISQTVSLDITGFTPHLGQKVEARLINKSTTEEADRTMIDPVTMAAFNLTLVGEVGQSYWIDFYADLNMNGIYDAPPTDHAWRISADTLPIDTKVIPFPHNTTFTDIMWPATTGLEDALVHNSGILVYPNPFTGSLNISTTENRTISVELSNSIGQIIPTGSTDTFGDLIRITGLNDLAPGLYYLTVYDTVGLHSVRLIKQ